MANDYEAVLFSGWKLLCLSGRSFCWRSVTGVGTQAGLRDFFAEWRECKAQLWDYEVSHSQLTLSLTHADARGALLLCAFTRSVHLPKICWSAKLSLREAADCESSQLLDEYADARIVCSMIGVFYDL